MIVYPNLTKPQPGKAVSAKWGSDVVDAIKSMTPISGKNVRLTRTKHGTIIDVDVEEVKRSTSGGDSVGAVPVKITGGNAMVGYAVDVYGNGLLENKTGTGTLMTMQFNSNTNLPVGTVVLGWNTKAFIIGGSEQTS